MENTRLTENELHKEMKGVYDYIESTRSEHSKLFSSIAQDIASLNVQVGNTSATVKDLADTVKNQSRFPVGLVMSGLFGTISIIALLAGGYIGQPLKELKEAHVTLSTEFNEHQQNNAGVNAEQKVYIEGIKNFQKDLDTILQREMRLLDTTLQREMALNDQINKEQIESIKATVSHMASGLEAASSNRYTKQDAQKDVDYLNSKVDKLQDVITERLDGDDEH